MRYLVKQACTLYWKYLLDCCQNTIGKGVEMHGNKQWIFNELQMCSVEDRRMLLSVLHVWEKWSHEPLSLVCF